MFIASQAMAITAVYNLNRDAVNISYKNKMQRVTIEVLNSRNVLMEVFSTSFNRVWLKAKYINPGKKYRINLYVGEKLKEYTYYTFIAPAAPAVIGRLSTEIAAGRTGYYYLPTGYNLRPMPLMISFHGTGWDGMDMIDIFSDMAEQYGFIIVAPDSNGARPEWEVPGIPYISDNYIHTRDCVDEVEALPKVRIDSNHVLSSGFSGGAWMAGYYGSTNMTIKQMAVLHGGVYEGGFGSNRPRAWFSCGSNDHICNCYLVKLAHDASVVLGFQTVTSTFDSAHEEISAEKNALVQWWLQ